MTPLPAGRTVPRQIAPEQMPGRNRVAIVKNRKETIRRLAMLVFEVTKSTWLHSQREKLKGGYDLSESEFLALDALEHVPSLSVGELRRCVGVLPAQMSRILKALEQRYDEKLVLCSINPQDKRKINVSITPKGRRAIEAYRRAKIMTSIKAMESLPDRDLANLAVILDKIGMAMARNRQRETP